MESTQCAICGESLDDEQDIDEHICEVEHGKM